MPWNAFKCLLNGASMDTSWSDRLSLTEIALDNWMFPMFLQKDWFVLQIGKMPFQITILYYVAICWSCVCSKWYGYLCTIRLLIWRGRSCKSSATCQRIHLLTLICSSYIGGGDLILTRLISKTIINFSHFEYSARSIASQSPNFEVNREFVKKNTKQTDCFYVGWFFKLVKGIMLNIIYKWWFVPFQKTIGNLAMPLIQIIPTIRVAFLWPSKTKLQEYNKNH